MLRFLAVMGPHRDSLEYKGTPGYQRTLLGLPQWLLGSQLSWWGAAVSKVGCRVGSWELTPQPTLANTWSLEQGDSNSSAGPTGLLSQFQSCRFESQEHCTSSHNRRYFCCFLQPQWKVMSVKTLLLPLRGWRLLRKRENTQRSTPSESVTDTASPRDSVMDLAHAL